MRVSLLGCLVDNVSMKETVSRVVQLINEGGPHQHVVVNVDKIVKANRDPRLRDIINECALINADGMPVLWASRLLGRPLKERVTGIDLFIRLLEVSTEKGWRVFFLGAREMVVSKMVALFQERYQSLKIAGYRNGYWQAEEEQSVVNEIKKSRADILFVGISSPKKEEFLEKYLEDVRVPFAMGVGGAFDMVVGVTKRAPTWMQEMGLEWFFRFVQEPKRLFRRYFVDSIQFFCLLAKEMVPCTKSLKAWGLSIDWLKARVKRYIAKTTKGNARSS